MSDDAARWQRLQEIVHTALDRPAEQRAAFLDHACDGDEDLRREAASLLEQDARASAFLATPLAALAAGAVTYSPGGTPNLDESRDLIGARLGDYEIRTRIGAGGMGEVYRARDHALHRDVAIKVLPAAFATDPERLVRFEREAVLLASLNHTHIGAVYGLAGGGNLRGIVLELIEGETLEARLARGPIPVAQAMTLAQQIARALDHAHQHGVMHRDLKPANIMLTKSGAKLLDFGLAKWAAPPSGYSPARGSTTARPEGAESVTSEGSILGTLHYMAPEQLEGKHVDARADVFAFGALLYEMLTGHRAFAGGSAAAVMASVLNTEPAALDTVTQLASPALERVVRKCLAKDPDHRWQTFRDLADELQWIAGQSERREPVVVDRGARPAGLNRWAILGVATIALALMGWAGWRIGTASESVAPRTPVRFTAMPSVAGGFRAFDISPDGTTLVYTNNGALYLRRFAEVTDVLIPGTEGTDEVAFSPDGQWVAFYSREKLLKVNVKAMTAPILLWAGKGQAVVRGTAWLDNDTIVTMRLGEQGLMRVPAGGGPPQPLTTFTETPPEGDHHHPQMLPGGRALIFTVHGNNTFKVVAQAYSPETGKVVGERHVLLESAFDAQYVETGHLVFARPQAILAVPFDAKALTITGPEVTLVEDAAIVEFDGNGSYRVSKNGTLVFLPTSSQGGRQFVWVDRTGTETPLPLGAHEFGSPNISPDGKRMAYTQADGPRRDVLTYEFATERVTPITRGGTSGVPIWTPDGERLTYASTRDGTHGLFVQAPGGAPERLVSGNVSFIPGAWTRDGQVLVYWVGSSSNDGDHIYSVALNDRKPAQILHAAGIQRQPSLSPDGRWIAYMSTETKRGEVYVSDYPEFTSKFPISLDGGREPRWSRDGKELVYRSFDKIFAVTIDTTPRFSPGKPRLLFDREHAIGQREFGLDYDLAPDGRFLMMKRGPDEGKPVGFSVVLNWVDDFARRVPTNQ